MIKKLKDNAVCQLCGSKFYVDDKTTDFACTNPNCKMSEGYNKYIKGLMELEKNRRVEYKKMLDSLKEYKYHKNENLKMNSVLGQLFPEGDKKNEKI